MNKGYAVGNAELFCPLLSLLAEQRAHINADTANAVVARPGTEHLPGTAAEVE